MTEFDIYFVGEWIQPKKTFRRHPNRYRFVTLNESKFVEMELPTGFIATCSWEDEKLVRSYRWSYYSNEHGVATVLTKDGIQTRIFFRRLAICAKNGDIVTHINGDPLDCRRENLEIKKQAVREDLKQKPKKVNIYYPQIVSAGKWRRGKPAGCLSKRDNRVLVRFSSPSLCKTFNLNSYETEKECVKAANLFRYEEADRRGLVRNKIRNVTLTNGETCLEVQLNGKRSFFCDLEDRKIVEKVVWSARTDKENSYASHSTRAKTNMNSERFHVVITGYTTTDHINGNTLDNRKSNLREGKGNVNPRNCKKRTDNTSGITGVTFTKGAWIVQWPEDGIRKSKRFGSSYGTDEEAKNAAIAFRKRLNKKLELHPRQ